MIRFIIFNVTFNYLRIKLSILISFNLHKFYYWHVLVAHY